jgi:hypothetical protein
VKRGLCVAAAAIALAGCKTSPTGPSSAPDTSMTVEQLAAAVAADARRSDLETDSGIRNQLAADALRDAQACLDRAPHDAACLYYQAIALGLKARAHPLQANDALKSMLEALGAAEAANPEYDQAGPARVKALVLVKAPSWPLGPGDAESGLGSARQAVALRPQYPPNVLALAEALAKTGDTNGAQSAYRHARELSQDLPPSADREDWLREADRAIQRASPAH